jgi:chromosomal replication initiator protein
VTDHITLTDAQQAYDAAVGSAMLKNAILRAQGRSGEILNFGPRPTAKTLRRKCCPTCGGSFEKLTGIAKIQALVADYYGVPRNEMESQRRGREVARPRQVAMFLSRDFTLYSLPSIGRRFGNRDHTTVIHAIKTIERLIGVDDQIAEDVEVLSEKLAG